MVTVASFTRAPVLSRTVPRMVPVVIWAFIATGSSTARNTAVPKLFHLIWQCLRRKCRRVECRVWFAASWFRELGCAVLIDSENAIVKENFSRVGEIRGFFLTLVRHLAIRATELRV